MAVKCPYCGAWFKTARGRNIHIALVHGQKKLASFKLKIKIRKRR